MNARLAQSERDAQLWDNFAERRPEATGCHRWAWKQVIERSFGWPTYYLLAEDGGQVRGVLPLVWQKSWLFGSFLTSLPFLNAGGVLAQDDAAQQALVDEAVALARRLRVRYLELRHRGETRMELPAKTNKVTLLKAVLPDEEKMFAALPHKVRTDVRKGIKSELAAEFGGAEFLDDFYSVFAVNMRDLGTPAYARSFFGEILRAFPGDTRICVVRHQGQPIAASFLIAFRDTIEALWSSSLYRFSALRPNMFLYWRILCFAGQQGYRYFDFGRSSVGSGTHRFKLQWGTEEVPLPWFYWLPEGAALPELNPENPRYGLAIRIWRKLPVGLTKLLGPPIVKRLP